MTIQRSLSALLGTSFDYPFALIRIPYYPAPGPVLLVHHAFALEMLIALQDQVECHPECAGPGEEENRHQDRRADADDFLLEEREVASQQDDHDDCEADDLGSDQIEGIATDEVAAFGLELIPAPWATRFDPERKADDAALTAIGTLEQQTTLDQHIPALGASGRKVTFSGPGLAHAPVVTGTLVQWLGRPRSSLRHLVRYRLSLFFTMRVFTCPDGVSTMTDRELHHALLADGA